MAVDLDKTIRHLDEINYIKIKIFGFESVELGENAEKCAICLNEFENDQKVVKIHPEDPPVIYIYIF